MKIFIDTDPHGIAGISFGEKLAMSRDITTRICLGDIWDANHARRIETHYIRGNHENDKHWLNPPKNVIYHEDYSTFVLDGIKFGVLGRADPVVTQRVLEERPNLWLGHPSNRCFQIREDASQLLKGSDILLFHDTPYPFVGSGWIGGSTFLKLLLLTVKPKLVFHGHLHQLQTRRWEDTEIIGLPPIDPTYYQQGWCTLDTQTMDVQIETQVRPKLSNASNV